MRLIFLTLFFLINSILTTQAQSILSDAMILTQCLTNKEEKGTRTMYAIRGAEDTSSQYTKEQCYSVLWKYTSTEERGTLAEEYFDNPYISAFDNPVVYFPDNAQTFKEGIAEVYKNMNPKVEAGGPVASTATPFSVTNIADGLAKFIAKRMKQELTLAFFDRFKKALTERPEIGLLFPRTTSMLKLINKEIYNFDSYIGVLRENFIIDLKLLPANAETWFTNTDFVKAEEKRILISDALAVGQRFVDGTNPLDVINYLANESQLQQPNRLEAISDTSKRLRFQRLAANMRLVNLLSSSIIEDEATAKWYQPKQIIDAFNNPATIYIYLGLMYQKREDVGQIGQIEFGEVLRPLAEKSSDAKLLVEDLKLEIRQISSDAKRIKNAVSQLKDVSWDSVGVEIFHQALSGFFGILSSGVQFQESFVPGFGDVKRLEKNLVEQQFVEILQNLNELHLNVRRKEYVMGVNNLSMLVKMLTDEKNDYIVSLIKYSNFMANVAEAQNSDEVAALIEAFALPPGGSRLKKESKFSVSINSYAGATVGWERLQVGNEVRTDNNTVLGFTAPVGLGFNRGFGDFGSFSAFVSIIDIGALTAFRIEDSTTNTLPELEWSNIVAPGGHLIYGFGGNLPGSFGIGVQRGPNLRKVTENGVDITASGWRIMATLTVDIPLFHLYTK